jgi:hypothetical protein
MGKYSATAKYKTGVRKGNDSIILLVGMIMMM